MYDNSASIALAGSGVTMLGQTASMAVLTVGGAALIALGIGATVGDYRAGRGGAHRASRTGGHRARP
jgi:hypothetical protein